MCGTLLFQCLHIFEIATISMCSTANNILFWYEATQQSDNNTNVCMLQLAASVLPRRL